MELHGEVLINASRHQVWQALNDPDVLVKCIPGCEEVRQLTPTETHVRVALRLGPVRARFVGKILMEDVVADQGCTLQFEGSGGAAGFARGQSKVALTDQGTATTLTYSASASIGGKLGQVGGRMIDASAKQMADQFFNALQQSFAAAPADTAAASPVTSAISAAPRTAQTSAPHSPTHSPTHSPLHSPMIAEGTRILWFVLGCLATSSGFMLASYLQR